MSNRTTSRTTTNSTLSKASRRTKAKPATASRRDGLALVHDAQVMAMQMRLMAMRCRHRSKVTGEGRRVYRAAGSFAGMIAKLTSALRQALSEAASIAADEERKRKPNSKYK